MEFVKGHQRGKLEPNRAAYQHMLLETKFSYFWTFTQGLLLMYGLVAHTKISLTEVSSSNCVTLFTIVSLIGMSGEKCPLSCK